MDELERELFVDEDCQKAAMVGLGGIGKTQVALQLAYSVLENRPDVSVLWIPALSTKTFEQACREITHVVGNSGQKMAKRMSESYFGGTSIQGEQASGC